MVFEINKKYFVVAQQQWGQDQDQKLLDKRIHIPTLSGTHLQQYFVLSFLYILSLSRSLYLYAYLSLPLHDFLWAWPQGRVRTYCRLSLFHPSPGSLLITMNHRPTFSKLGLPPLGTVSASPPPHTTRDLAKLISSLCVPETCQCSVRVPEYLVLPTVYKVPVFTFLPLKIAGWGGFSNGSKSSLLFSAVKKCLDGGGMIKISQIFRGN